MASAFHHVFKFDNTGLSYCSVEDKTIGDYNGKKKENKNYIRCY